MVRDHGQSLFDRKVGPSQADDHGDCSDAVDHTGASERGDDLAERVEIFDGALEC